MYTSININVLKSILYMQALMQLNDTLGCCFVDVLRGLIDSGYVF